MEVLVLFSVSRIDCHLCMMNPISWKDKVLIDNKNWLLYSATLGILLLFLSPHFSNIQESKFLIHDNLNSNVVWNTVLANSPDVFSIKNEKIEGILNALPSGVYRSEFTYITPLYRFFSPLIAYNINAIFIHLFAFFSALLFLRYSFKSMPIIIRIGLSLCFALLPFRTAALLSIAGQPIVALAAFQLVLKDNIKQSLLIMLAFPFFSDLFLVNTFTLFALISYVILQLIRDKSIPYLLLAGVSLLVIGSIVVHYKIFQLIFIDGFESHRSLTRTVASAGLNFKGFVGTSLMTAFKGQYHFHTFPYFITLPIWISGIVFSFRIKSKLKWILLSGFALLLIGFANQIWSWVPFAQFISNNSGFNAYNFRFYSLIPFFTLLMLAFSLNFSHTNKYFQAFSISAIMVLVVCTFLPTTIQDTNGSKFLESPFYDNYFYQKKGEHKTFDEYYKTEVFKNVEHELARISPEVKIACFGIDPAVAQMNGLSTVDGYFGIYSASYFKAWSKMLHNESNNNYLSWGNQCYLFSDELKINPRCEQIEQLKIRPELLKEIGANGILSRIEILKIGDRVIEPIILNTSDSKQPQLYYYVL